MSKKVPKKKNVGAEIILENIKFNKSIEQKYLESVECFTNIKSALEKKKNTSVVIHLVKLILHLLNSEYKSKSDEMPKATALLQQFLISYFDDENNKEVRLSIAEKFKKHMKEYNALELFEKFVIEFEQIIETGNDLSDEDTEFLKETISKL